MDILKKIFGKKETETRTESKKARDDARREKTKTPSTAKTSIIDKVKSQKEQNAKEQNAKKAPKGKAERAAQKAAQKSAQKTAQKAVKRR